MFSLLPLRDPLGSLKKPRALETRMVACEQALLFGRVKRAARERAFASPLACLSRVYFYDIPKVEILLAGYKNGNYPRSIRPLFDRPVVACLPL